MDTNTFTIAADLVSFEGPSGHMLPFVSGFAWTNGNQTLTINFASQSIACIRDLQVDPATVNIYGGAIALGHALGSSGSRMMATLVHALRRRKARYGVATMCIGVGQGIAVVVERV